MKQSSQDLGREGEETAQRHLQQLKHHILETNYQCPAGEMDIISMDPTARQICFVEVKSRSSESFAPAEASITRDKRKRLKGIAAYYLAANNIRNLAFRFDVIAVIIPPNGEKELRHHVDCF